MSERRAHPRRPVKLPLFVQAPEGVLRNWVEVQARNISEGGLSFETSWNVLRYSDARLAVRGLGGGLRDAAQVLTRVAHATCNPQTRTTHVGLDFTATNDTVLATATLPGHDREDRSTAERDAWGRTLPRVAMLESGCGWGLHRWELLERYDAAFPRWRCVKEGCTLNVWHGVTLPETVALQTGVVLARDLQR